MNQDTVDGSLRTFGKTYLHIYRILNDIGLHRYHGTHHITLIIVHLGYGVLITRNSVSKFLLVIDIAPLHSEHGR